MTERLLKKATADEIIREEALARDKFLLQQACRERQWARREKECIEKETQLAGKETQLSDKETQLFNKEAQLTEREKQLADKETQLANHEKQLSEAKEKIECDLVRKMRDSGMSKEQIAAVTELDQAAIEGYLGD